MSSFQVKLNYEDAQAPTRGSDEAAGYDLYSYESETVVPKQIKLIDTGISIRVPEGTYGRIAPRSSVSKKGILINAGVIDRDYIYLNEDGSLPNGLPQYVQKAFNKCIREGGE